MPRRRNRDFEKAGKEAPTRQLVDPVAASNLRKATKVRENEIVNASVIENRLLKGRSKESQEFREQKKLEKTSISQGTVINHLARMQQKSKKQDKKSRPAD